MKKNNNLEAVVNARINRSVKNYLEERAKMSVLARFALERLKRELEAIEGGYELKKHWGEEVKEKFYDHK